VGLLGGRGALEVTGLLLPSLALVLRRPLAAFETAASVPERPYELLRKLPFAEFLPIATIENLALRCMADNFEPGEAIVREGEVGDRFYVIESGCVAVDERGVFRRHQSTGEFFGEIALLRDIPRTATVRAVTAVSVLAISREDFLAAIGSHPRSERTVESVASERLQPMPHPR
jgi:CRP-like cAMP-binding protein